MYKYSVAHTKFFLWCIGFSGALGAYAPLTRVNSADVLDEGLRIGGRGRWMNSKLRFQTNKVNTVY
jgi:hypothetical protein